MNVLWIVNILLPEAAAKLTDNSELKSTGGWMIGSANSLIANHNIQLTIATVSSYVSKLVFIKGKKINYYVIPMGKGNVRYNKNYEKYWQQINNTLNPDVIHIHGSEFSHGLAFVNACGADNVVLSIQGLKSSYWRYYYSGISTWEVVKNYTIHDMLGCSIFKEKRIFKYSGDLEKILISKLHHIIGRTSWDRSLTWAINQDASYYFCNETLREEFYDGQVWNYESCNHHTIFLSQANYAIKGLHQVLKSLPLILKNYPDTMIRVAGGDLTKYCGIRGLKHYSGYMKYINSLLHKYNIKDHVVFTGSLNAEEMKKEYLRCNVFVCPSSIENSPNSLGEAQILGVPCIASYVGGIPDMMVGEEDYLYRFEEVEMLAYKICDLFKAPKDTSAIMERAKIRHSKLHNSNQLYSIYNKIIG